MREEISERVTTAKENVVVPKARTTCDDKRKRRSSNVPKKTKKAL